MYAQGPAAERYYGAQFSARADLVAARIITNKLDEAEDAMRPVLDMPVHYRTEGVILRLQHTLGHSRYASSAPARRVAGHIEAFMADGSSRALPPGIA